MAKANGIYERKGRHGDVTYYIRYQFKTTDGEGNEITKDLKEKVGQITGVYPRFGAGSPKGKRRRDCPRSI